MTRENAIREVVRRLVEHYHPERIYLVGSSARGDARADSDLDFVVVLPDDTPRDMLFDGAVYERLWGIPLAVDVVPFRHRTFEERSGWLMSLPAIALREGKLQYDSAAVRAFEEGVFEFERLKEPPARGSYEKFLRVMSKSPAVEPPEYDRF